MSRSKFKSVSSHFIVGVKDFAFSKELDSFLKDFPVSGMALFNSPFDQADNIWKNREASLERVHEFITKIEGRVNFLSVDQEGGRVRRLRGAYLNLPSGQEMGEKIKSFPEKAEKLYSYAAQQMAISNFNLNFAPVCDLLYDESSQVIGDRSFSKNPKDVVECARMICKVYEKAGVHTTLKHFPGHGPSKFDSHEKIALLFKDRRDLEKVDTKIFYDLQNDASAILTAHIAFEEFPDRIFSLDSEFITAARSKMRPELAWITDDLQNMKAVSSLKPWISAYSAGYDFLLLCGDLHQAADAIDETIRSVEQKTKDFAGEQAMTKRIERAHSFFNDSKKVLSFKSWKEQILDLEKRGNDILGEFGFVKVG